MKTARSDQLTEITESRETTEQKTIEVVTMTLETFCAHRQHNKMIEARLRIFLLEYEGESKYKTATEWDEVHKRIMNRVTK
jgi:hypothetical protein